MVEADVEEVVQVSASAPVMKGGVDLSHKLMDMHIKGKGLNSAVSQQSFAPELIEQLQGFSFDIHYIFLKRLVFRLIYGKYIRWFLNIAFKPI